MRNYSLTNYLLVFLVFSFLFFTSCVQDKSGDTAYALEEIIGSKDSVSIKCLGDMDFAEEIDTLFLEDGVLTCKLGKYENCAFSQLDTFYFKNDTLDLRLTSADGERLACDCYLGIYARFSYPFKKPGTLTVNGHAIGSGHGIVIATEEQ